MKLRILALAICLLPFAIAPCAHAEGTLVVNDHLGFHIGSTVTQKIGLFGATPIVQPSGSTEAAVTQTQDALTDSSGGTPSTTLAAITAGGSYAQADMTATKNAVATLAAELAKVKTDLAAAMALVNKLRADLVALGAIKGGS